MYLIVEPNRNSWLCNV